MDTLYIIAFQEKRGGSYVGHYLFLSLRRAWAMIRVMIRVYRCFGILLSINTNLTVANE